MKRNMDRLSLLLTIVIMSRGDVGGAAQVQPQPSRSAQFTIAPRTNCPKIPTDNTELPGRANTRVSLKELRQVMRSVEHVRGPPLDAYIVTTEDEHQTGSPLNHDRRLRFISGFSGSTGEAIITKLGSALWTDARYYGQADSELGCNWQILRNGIRNTPTAAEWISQNVNRKGKIRVGADPKLVPHHTWITWATEFEKNNMTLIPILANLIDSIWTSDRPEMPSMSMFVHSFEYTGETWQSKVKRVRGALQAMGADALVVTALDEIAWLLNIRGRDAMYLPVARAYVILFHQKIFMYVPGASVPESVSNHLRTFNCISDPFCVRIFEYDQFWKDLPTFSQSWNKVLLPVQFSYNSGCSHRVVTQVPEEKRMMQPSPIMMLKAVKNSVEIEGMKRAHIRDAVALCEFMAYFEDKMSEGEKWSEFQVASTLDKFRYDQHLSQGASFKTIVGFGPNGAQPHYRPQLNSSLVIAKNSTLVIDSGGQYLDGTTDVSRTFHFGSPTLKQQEAYTRALAGLLTLSKLRFPNSVDTTDVDVLARSHLWAAGMDYMHGTGHGIGSFLGVHEPPISIHYNSRQKKSFEAGHFLTVEPGFYQDGDFGVRVENVLEVVLVKQKYNVSGPYYGFKTTTLVPYEPKLINTDFLTPDLRKMINEYNAKVRQLVGSELKKKPDLKGFKWMMQKTGYIPEWLPPKNSKSSMHQESIKLSFLILSVVTILL
ncbi:xaa-Pro aminopeptidase 1-like isoform X2 [Neocloeon triangulifer]|uniref:xaa-Pro aminopeptidase 1-like isoform X2 n=1 Tax=Neocloeon triangulifer TaxID=2078957 RepID=UPI00286F18AC|nr:xaa-Pro aminopeptidase 1-like isoform X2 [Neocloeon triangulifer]